MASKLSRTKRTVSTPGEADTTIEKRLATLGMSFSEYVNSLIAYDCWAERPHLLTGDAVSGDKVDELVLWKEIEADFGKPNKVGSYFEARVRAFVLAKLEPPTPESK